MSHPPKLIVTVDTEEEGLWGGNYRVHGNTTENLRGLIRFQETCESLGVAPTYLVDAPVLDNTLAVRNLKRWLQHERCEIGSHCHPWCNPPFINSPTNSYTSYLCNLPKELQHDKLQWLTQRIQDTFEIRPTSYRAGRYGFDSTSAEILNDLGYLVDSSVLPTFNYQREGGPDFTNANPYPHKLIGSLQEIPITAGFTRGNYKKQLKRWNLLRAEKIRKYKIAGIADYIGLVRKLKLSPEGNKQSDLMKLARNSIRAGRTTLVLMLHSSSLAPGFSPYVKTAEDLDSFYKTFISVVRYAINKQHAEPTGLTQHWSAKSSIAN